jgi:predicted aldo/keto reductase-like oxidoreductase
LVRSAIDRGITFMDNCWDYNNGQSEIRMGKALRDGYREKVFLMTKIEALHYVMSLPTSVVIITKPWFFD